MQCSRVAAAGSHTDPAANADHWCSVSGQGASRLRNDGYDVTMRCRKQPPQRGRRIMADYCLALASRWGSRGSLATGIYSSAESPPLKRDGLPKASSGRRPTSATFPPSNRIRRATAAPIPVPPPVIKAVLFLKRKAAEPSCPLLQ